MTAFVSFMFLSFLSCAPRTPTGRVSFWAAADGFAPGPAPVATALEEETDLFDPATRRVGLSAALNETTAFRLWLSYSGQGQTEVSVTVDAWESGSASLPAEAVTLYRVHAVRVSHWPGWYLRSVEPDRRQEFVEDVLVPAAAPRGGLPGTMSDGDTLSLWVEVHVAKGTRPGTFWSKLHIRGDGRELTAVDMRLEVLPFVLPEVTEVVLAADVDHTALFAHHVTYNGRPCRAERILADSPLRSELQSVLDTTMRLLRAHQVTPLLSTLHPVIKIDAQDEVTVHWADYDAAVGGYLEGTKFVDRLPLPLWVVPFDERFPIPPAYGATQSPSFSRHLRQYLAQCADHFAAQGWLERSFVEIPFADFPTREALQAAEHFARVIREADPRLRILCNLFPQDLGPYGWPDFPVGDLLGYVDIWCPPAQFHAPPESPSGRADMFTVGEPRRLGHGLGAILTDGSGTVPPTAPPTVHTYGATAAMWMAVDRPPFSGSIDLGAPAADTRVLPWQAYRQGAAVLRLGWVNRWPEPSHGLTAQDCLDSLNRDRQAVDSLIYPGDIAGLTEPIPSVRLKRLRRGMTDLAYLKLMREKGLADAVDLLAESLAPYAGAQAYRYHYADPQAEGWVRESQWWHQAERLMIDELAFALADRPVEPAAKRAVKVRWERWLAAVRQMHVEVDGVRVRQVNPATVQGDTWIECAVTFRNGTRTPARGRLGFGELPMGWKGRDGPIDVFVAPGDSSRWVLSASATAVTWDEDGVRYLPIEFAAVGGKVLRLSARMSYVAAQPWYERLRIDGDLSDWPPAVANLASDFVLVSGEDPERLRDERARPTSKTRVYVAADTQALYFAFDCALQGTAPMLPAHSNVVEYDDMIPVGDELVEILLDPTGAGTHSTSDLYHVVIKPTGALWERGIDTSPPTGRRAVWAAEVRHAARTYPDRWVGEVRIPLEAFGVASVGRIWAVNFTRFDSAHQEYSNWAGAVRHGYDPASLGNLALP